jgi:hypothetical protein
MRGKKAPQRMSIGDLEKLLNSETQDEFEILPDGTIMQLSKGRRRNTKRKPVTMKENLGGEYGQHNSI